MEIRRIWREYGLSITLAVLFLAAWTLQTWTGWTAFAAEQLAHGQTPAAFGEDGYVWQWAESKEVSPAAHWAYLFGVGGGGLVAMLALIAWLGGS